METKSSSTDSILKLELQLDPLPLSTDGVKEACRDCVILVHGEFKPSLGSLSMCGTKGGATRTSPVWRSGAVVERSGTHQVSTGGVAVQDILTSVREKAPQGRRPSNTSMVSSIQ